VRAHVVAIGVAVFSLSTASADEPLPAPLTYTIRPAHTKACWAEVSVEDNALTVYRKTAKGREAVWSVPGWHRVADLADDCRSLMTGYDGQSLLADADPSTVLLRFYRDGKLLREYRLDELMDPKRLRRTVSHFEWGNYLGVERGHFYRIETNGRGEQVFDMATGQPSAAVKRTR
jgi:hypothetical protein